MENKNKPAFPRPYSRDEHSGDMPENHYPFDGMSIRQYAAIKAMQGLLSNIDKYDESEKGDNIKLLCADAVEIADELLNQLEQ